MRVDARAWQCETKFRDRSDLGTGIRCIGCACRGTRASPTADRRLCLVWLGFAGAPRWQEAALFSSPISAGDKMQFQPQSGQRSRVAAVSRSATVAWGPTSAHANLMAAGTVAGAISDSFDASAQLEIFSLDLGSRTGEMPLLGSVQTNDRFHRLAWGRYGHESGALSHGLLAGGMVDGTIKVFNPALMIG